MILVILTSSMFLVKIRVFTRFRWSTFILVWAWKPPKHNEKAEPTLLIYLPAMSWIIMDRCKSRLNFCSAAQALKEDLSVPDVQADFV